jgi:type 1 glutamine amidotransferase
MSSALNRRQVLFAAGAAMLGASPLARAYASARAKADPKKVLFFTKSSGFQHSVITRKGDSLSMAEKILTSIGKDNGFEVVCSKDGTNFDPDKIAQWDAFAFETTGDLTTPGPHNDGPPMSKDGKKAFLDAIAAGKGFLGMHCATDTFHSKEGEVDPYIKMIGGEFISHGAQQVADLYVTDGDFPGVKPFGSTFRINDEWYSQKNIANDLHVVIAHDTSKMKGWEYERPNFPQTWARMHGKGRVFYTSMGHREDVWENPLYQGLLVGALGWATGLVDISVEPNVAKVTPGYATDPKRPAPAAKKALSGR